MPEAKQTQEGVGPRQRFRHSRRLGIARSLMLNLAIVAIPLLIYVVVVMKHSSSYNDERSLRALQEVAAQIDNRLDVLKNALDTTPIDREEGVVHTPLRVPFDEFSFGQPCSEKSNGDPGHSADSCECMQGAGEGVIVRIGMKGDQAIRLANCNRSSWKGMQPPVVQTSFGQMIDNTAALAEMPMLFVVNSDGAVYTQLIRNHSSDPSPPAHEEVREEAEATNLSDILAAARHSAASQLWGDGEHDSASGNDASQGKAKENKGGSEDQSKATGSASLGLPVAFDAHVAGEPYRAYVLPYRLKIPACEPQKKGAEHADLDARDDDRKNDGGSASQNGALKAESSKCSQSYKVIYLVGMRKAGILSQATNSLSPVMLLGTIFMLITGMLLWPFVRHAMLEPNDAVTWRQVRILCIAFLLLTSVGIVASRSFEIGHFMYKKMDAALIPIADEIECQLHRRVRNELRVIGVFNGLPAPGAPLDNCWGDWPAVTGVIKGDDPVAFSVADRFFTVSKNGVLSSNSGTYSFLLHKWQLLGRTFDLSKRPYFYLLQRGMGQTDEKAKAGPYILQRLFNKTDGKKILQLAVSRKDGEGRFNGVDALNVGVIEAISPVLPLGVGYAIFERSTGTVVFHSDDRRSLVENFYAETERNPALLTAVADDSSGKVAFEGRYRGANTTFLYAPTAYAPWALVVFYDSSSVSAVVALSAISALAVTFATLMIGLALAQVTIWVMCRRHSWLWPQWRLRNAYPTMILFLAMVSVGEFLLLRSEASGVGQMIVLVTAPLFVLTACFAALCAKTPDVVRERPATFRYRLDLRALALLLNAILVVAWLLIAAWAREPLGAAMIVAAVSLLWVGIWKADEDPGSNRNAWRRDLILWPGESFEARNRSSYQARYLLFAVAVAVAASGAPALAMFDKTFEWYLVSALRLAKADTNAQWSDRVRNIAGDIRAAANSTNSGGESVASLIADKRSSHDTARRLGGVGVSPMGDDNFDVDGRLFGIAPSQCRDPHVVTPLGIWERKMLWQNRVLERLRQKAVVMAEMTSARPASGSSELCGVQGTIHEVLYRGGASGVAVVTSVALGVLIIALLMLLLNFSARHIMGIALPWSGRLGRQRAPEPKSDDSAAGAFAEHPSHLLLIQPTVETLSYVRGRMVSAVREIDVASHRINRVDFEERKPGTWILRRVDIAVLDEKRRLTLLSLIERLVSDAEVSVVIVGDVSPVYRLARPQAYPGPAWPQISDHERLRWIDVFARFQKIYSVADAMLVFNDPSESSERKAYAHPTELDELIYRETRALWPRLQPIRQVLLSRTSTEAPMTDRDVIEFVALHGEVHFRRAWEYCTREERLALYHLAQGKLINMANHRVVEHLLRRGLVVFEPEPRVKSISLAEFIVNAELPGRMEKWSDEAAEGLWQSLRVPFFVSLMVIVAWVAYSSGDAFQAIVALVATSVAVIGQALRLLGMVGFSSSSAKDK